MFIDVGLSEDEINKKYPEPTFFEKAKKFINKYKIIIAPLIIILIIYLIESNYQNRLTHSHNFSQSGGNPLFAKAALKSVANKDIIANTVKSSGATNIAAINTSQTNTGTPTNSSSKSSTLKKVTSPVSTTFGMITNALGKFLKLLMLLIMIVLVPSVPIILYCLIAYYVIKRFLFMVTSVE